jgi:3-methyladenine DNA glycosylase AlkC
MFDKVFKDSAASKKAWQSRGASHSGMKSLLGRMDKSIMQMAHNKGKTPEEVKAQMERNAKARAISGPGSTKTNKSVEDAASIASVLGVIK